MKRYEWEWIAALVIILMLMWCLDRALEDEADQQQQVERIQQRLKEPKFMEK